MKPKLVLRKNNSLSNSISVQQESLPHFLCEWHRHEELEIVYILKGTGTYYIGDTEKYFQPGTLVVLGSMLCHKWQNHDIYFHDIPTLYAEALVIHFNPEFLNTDISTIPEFATIGKFLKNAKQGIEMYNLGDEPVNLLTKINTLAGGEQLVDFLMLLNILSTHDDFDFLASPGFIGKCYASNNRISTTYEYMMNNFQKDIRLEEVASNANMNASAFSRYFKKINQKTFSRYLNEIRIGYACKLLQQEGYNISEVAYECGYNNTSNFNRQFKLITGDNPSDYISRFV